MAGCVHCCRFHHLRRHRRRRRRRRLYKRCERGAIQRIMNGWTIKIAFVICKWHISTFLVKPLHPQKICSPFLCDALIDANYNQCKIVDNTKTTLNFDVIRKNKTNNWKLFFFFSCIRCLYDCIFQMRGSEMWEIEKYKFK